MSGTRCPCCQQPQLVPRPLALCALLIIAAPAFAQQQHPYFPLNDGAVWTYRFPSVKDPNNNSSETIRVVEQNAAENTYTVERTMRLVTLPPDKGRVVYEVRNGNVLDMGGEIISGPTGELVEALGERPGFRANIPAPIVLKANLTKGMHWKEGPKTDMRACEVLDFVTLKVPAGEYKNVAKLRVKVTYISSETGREESAPTTLEYYAPNVGLVKTDLLRKDGTTGAFMELVSYTPGAR